MNSFPAPAVAEAMVDPARAIPLRFGSAAMRCFGWLHRGHGPRRDVGIVLCSPSGYEGNCVYETLTQLAERLAAAGFDVLRYDPHGTGDSLGQDSDPDRVAAWLDSAKSAFAELRKLTCVSTLAAFGVRLGATLAASAASQIGGVESLVLWAPCVSGRTFTRELRAAAVPGEERGVLPPNSIEALGYLYTEQTLRDLAALDLLRLDPPPAKHVLVIARDDMPSEGPLPQALRKAGIDTTFQVLPGYRSMMNEPHASDVAQATLDSIVTWYGERHPVPANGASVTAAVEPEPAEISDATVRETGLRFGPGKSLFGILAEPQVSPSAADPRSQRAILLINVGNNHRIGPNRLYVTMARAWAARGERTFRFDLSGIGDSRAGSSASPAGLYRKESVAEVRMAMDTLAQQGCREFVVLGVCSGAYIAFQTSLEDPRVVGQVLLNPRRLEWKDGDTLKSAMSQSYKSTHFYRNALLEPGTYRRLVSGQINVRGISARVRTLVSARMKRAARRAFGIGPSEGDVLAKVRMACDRGVDTLFVVASADDCLDYLEFHLGTRGRNMGNAPNFTMHYVEGGDHTFAHMAGQGAVVDYIGKHLSKRDR